MKRRVSFLVASILAVGLLSAQAGWAQTKYKYLKLGAQGEFPGAGVGDVELTGLNNLGHFAIVTEPESTVGGEVFFFHDGTNARKIERSPAIWNPGGINELDQVVFTLQIGDDNHTETHLFDMRTGEKKVLTKPDLPVGSAKIAALPLRSSAQINERSEVVCVVPLADDADEDTQAVVMVAPDGALKLIAGPGTPGPGGKNFTSCRFPSINDSGVIAFVGRQDGVDGRGVYLYENGTITALATPDMDVPGGPGKFQDLMFCYINNDGNIVFRSAAGLDSQGLFLYQKSTGKVVQLAKTNQDIAGVGKFLQVEGDRRHSAIINNKGLIAVNAYLDDDVAGGVFTYDIASGAFNLVAKTGMDLPGVGKIENMSNGRNGFASFHININDNGEITFCATISGVETVIKATPQ